MVIVGLTGGIATGKSAVAQMFADLGARIHSADTDARTVLAPGSPTLPLVFAQFPNVRAEDGTLDRARLAALVFADAEARKRLEALTHPPIIAHMKATIAKARHEGDRRVLVYETPLLYEARLEGLFDVVIATLAPPFVQAERLQEREGRAGRPRLSEDAVADRLAAQLPIEEKARRADFVIRTDVSLDETRARVRGVWDALVSPSPILPHSSQA